MRLAFFSHMISLARKERFLCAILLESEQRISRSSSTWLRFVVRMSFRATWFGIGTIPIRQSIWIERKRTLRWWRQRIRSVLSTSDASIDLRHFIVRFLTILQLIFVDQFIGWCNHHRRFIVRFDQFQWDRRLGPGEKRTWLISLSSCHRRRRCTGNIIEEDRDLWK